TTLLFSILSHTPPTTAIYSLSLHDALPIFGQSLLAPSQLSATSQTPAEGRQTAVLLTSAGHAALVPVQLSATSQTPAEPRQMVVAGSNRSGGQSLVTPLQLSATSHTPADARHSAVLLAS